MQFHIIDQMSVSCCMLSSKQLVCQQVEEEIWEGRTAIAIVIISHLVFVVFEFVSQCIVMNVSSIFAAQINHLITQVGKPCDIQFCVQTFEW